MDTITELKEKLQKLKTRMSKESGRTRKITNSDIATVHSQIREMENMEWRCICGKQIPEGTIYCSDRCAWIAEKMDTPLGQQMDNVDRAISYFGKQYDRMHGEKQ